MVGENGAGKSTLAKILYGFYRADAGAITLDGTPVVIRAPEDARALGIGMVFQDLVQVLAFTVAENVALFLPDLPAVLGRAALAPRIATTSSATASASIRPPRCGGSRSASGRRWRSSSSCSRRPVCSSSTSRREPGAARGRRACSTS